MEVLLDNGIDVNLQGKSTGYSFIHLALYGYTDKNGDHSYSTDFIKKLILLARKYNFNVNIKDDDGDSLIHTALASEVYEGSTIQLIEALGHEYDVLCRDDDGSNIYEALLEYKKEAGIIDDKWYNRLLNEEEEIKLLVKNRENNVDKTENIDSDSILKDSYKIVELNEEYESNEENESVSAIEEDESMEEELLKVDDSFKENESVSAIEEDESIEEELFKVDDSFKENESVSAIEGNESIEELTTVKVSLDTLKIDINKLLDVIDIEYLMINYELIFNIKEELVAYLSESNVSVEDKLELEVLQNRFDLLLRIIINNYLRVMGKNPNIEEVDKLLKILELFGYNLESQLLERVKLEYLKMNRITIDDIEKSKTLSDLTIVRKKIENIEDDNYKNNLLEKLNVKEMLFLEQIESLKNKINFINIIKNMRLIDSLEFEVINNLDYQNMTMEFVRDLDNKIYDVVIENQNVLLNSLKRKLDELSMLLLSGEDSETFMKDFSEIGNLYQFINSIIKDNSTKVMVRKNG